MFPQVLTERAFATPDNSLIRTAAHQINKTTSVSNLFPQTSCELVVDIIHLQGVNGYHEYNGVVFALPEEASYDLESLIIKLLDHLEPIKDKLISAVTNEFIEGELSCIASFTHPPSCYFSVETISATPLVSTNDFAAMFVSRG